MSYIDTYVSTIAPRWEGRINYLYLDTQGLVTTAIGCMIADPVTAGTIGLCLPTGLAATAAQAAAEWTRVKALPNGRLASFYKSANSLILPVPAIDALVRTRVVAFEAELIKIFPDFPTYPDPIKLALMDMIFNLGPGVPPGYSHLHPNGSGLQEYTHLVASVKAQQWAQAANQCQRDSANPAFAERNAWTKSQFL